MALRVLSSLCLLTMPSCVDRETGAGARGRITSEGDVRDWPLAARTVSQVSMPPPPTPPEHDDAFAAAEAPANKPAGPGSALFSRVAVFQRRWGAAGLKYSLVFNILAALLIVGVGIWFTSLMPLTVASTIMLCVTIGVFIVSQVLMIAAAVVKIRYMRQLDYAGDDPGIISAGLERCGWRMDTIGSTLTLTGFGLLLMTVVVQKSPGYLLHPQVAIFFLLYLFVPLGLSGTQILARSRRERETAAEAAESAAGEGVEDVPSALRTLSLPAELGFLASGSYQRWARRGVSAADRKVVLTAAEAAAIDGGANTGAVEDEVLRFAFAPVLRTYRAGTGYRWSFTSQLTGPSKDSVWSQNALVFSNRAIYLIPVCTPAMWSLVRESMDGEGYGQSKMSAFRTGDSIQSQLSAQMASGPFPVAISIDPRTLRIDAERVGLKMIPGAAIKIGNSPAIINALAIDVDGRPFTQMSFRSAEAAVAFADAARAKGIPIR